MVKISPADLTKAHTKPIMMKSPSGETRLLRAPLQSQQNRPADIPLTVNLHTLPPTDGFDSILLP
jgi:hypothetical protein